MIKSRWFTLWSCGAWFAVLNGVILLTVREIKFHGAVQWGFVGTGISCFIVGLTMQYREKKHASK